MHSLLKPVEVSFESVTTLLELYNMHSLLKPVEVSIASVTTLLEHYNSVVTDSMLTSTGFKRECIF